MPALSDARSYVGRATLAGKFGSVARESFTVMVRRLLLFDASASDPFAPFTGRKWPEGPDEEQSEISKVLAAPHLPAGILSRERGEER
jgi:hypothetical protein